ncbi:MAG TPA: hypothetical protein VGW38_11540, partial [Chloroflexota bacterium]|nr:hypothetical protein [Chloroflexota bacterium]
LSTEGRRPLALGIDRTCFTNTGAPAKVGLRRISRAVAQIYLKQGPRCQEHPHRETLRRCDRCGLPFCEECLLPAGRKADGTRDWLCARCTTALRIAAVRAASARRWRSRLARLTALGQIVGVSLAGVLLLGAIMTFGAQFLPRSAASAPSPALEARCSELSRIRSIGAIGTQAAEDAVNVLTYPQRAAVTLLTGSEVGEAGSVAASTAPEVPAFQASPVGTAGTEPVRASGVAALVDECDTGWHSDGPLSLPVTLTVDIHHSGAHIQRIALWQDPKAPRTAWVQEFQVFASPSAAGEDFVPVRFDRPAVLRETTEAQWFEIVSPGPGALAQPFPAVVEMRRLRLRLLSTYGSAGRQAPSATPGRAAVALGEIAAYGPDLEVVIAHPLVNHQEDTTRFVFVPHDIRALAQQPKFVLFINRTRTWTHTIRSVGQKQNFEVAIEPGQAKSVQFIAGTPGRYEFFCTVVNHDRQGLLGSIIVR